MSKPRAFALVALLLCASGAAAQTPTCPSGPPCQGGPLPTPPLFPITNWWNRDISSWPVDINSGNFITFVGLTRPIHPDWGGQSSPFPEIYGFPYIVVHGNATTKLAVQFVVPEESDGVDHSTQTSFPFYPIPPQAITSNQWIEGGWPGNEDHTSQNDRHMLIVDIDNNYLYELYNVFYDGVRWNAYSGAFFDMNTNNRRPEGWTSADAAGLAIMPGLARYDEAYLGTQPIRHALRFTVRATNGYVYPASHLTCDVTAGDPCPPNALPMGARLRLMPGVNVSSSDPGVQRIVQALKTYGMIVADNGSDMYVSGVFDDRWDNGILNPALGQLHTPDFEVIQLGYNPPACNVPALSINDVSLPEGNSGATSAVFTVSLDQPTLAGCAQVSVNFTTANGTATAGSDYMATAGGLTFATGAVSTTVSVPVYGDRIFEPNETFFVNLSNAANATLADAQGLGTILNDDTAGFSINDVTVVERRSGPATATFNVTLAPTSGVPTSVDFQTADGSATVAGGDYNPASGTLSFPAGTASRPVSVTVNSDGLLEGAETFTVGLLNPLGGPGVGFSPGTATILDPWPGGDFNSDGKPDILWRHDVSGKNVVWYMDGVTRIAGVYTSPDTLPDTNWRIVGTADFDADGKTDILFRHAVSGKNVVWTMDGITRTAGVFTNPSALADTNWKMVGTGDFNVDGKPDILFRHGVSGKNVVWTMDGVSRTGGVFTVPDSLADTNWQMVGVGDFSNDGKVDILWRHNVSGKNVAWYMDGVVRTGGVFTNPDNLSDTYWRMVGVGDYSSPADDKPDILWRHGVSGKIVVWYMDGITRTGGVFTNPSSLPDTNWKIVGPK